ncbi:hypothetical protein, partial [Mycobacterium sp. UM_Kg1]|uniref:hypothetical protein n=1 Tax=Mycobacterium sp. UM_Kg1 TaxID=1545691 RepID=UPI00128CF28C
MTPDGPPYPASPHADFQPPPPRRRLLDVIGASLLAVLLLVACGLGWVYSMFAGMVTTQCSAAHQCSGGLISAAYLVSWGGMAVAIVTTL